MGSANVSNNQRMQFSRFISAALNKFRTDAANAVTMPHPKTDEFIQIMLLESASEQKVALQRTVPAKDASESRSTKELYVSKLIFFPGGSLYKATIYKLGADAVVYSHALKSEDITLNGDETIETIDDWQLAKELAVFLHDKDADTLGEMVDMTDMELITGSIDDSTAVPPEHLANGIHEEEVKEEAVLPEQKIKVNDIRVFITEAHKMFTSELFSMENKFQTKFAAEMKKDAKQNGDDFTPYWKYYLSEYEKKELEQMEGLVHKLRELADLFKSPEGIEFIERNQSIKSLSATDIAAIEKAQMLRNRFIVEHGEKHDPLPILARLIL